MATTTSKAKTTKYIEAVGRRKTAVARVRITEAAKPAYTINGRALAEYFPTEELQAIVTSPAKEAALDTKFSVSAKLVGGGVHAQAEAVRHGIARALVVFDENKRRELKKAGFLKRDPRTKERKKFGLRKARRAPQWSKR